MGISKKALITENLIYKFFNITVEVLPVQEEVHQSFSVSWYTMITNHFIDLGGSPWNPPDLLLTTW